MFQNLLKNGEKNIKINQSKSTMEKSEIEYSNEYFIEKESMLPKSIKEKISERYVYLWSKAAIYLSSGTESYRKEDYFKYPLKEWDIEQIDAGVIQIVRFLKGISPDYFIELNNIINVEELMLTFHFVKRSENKLGQNIFAITFEHRIIKDEITLFFKLKN